MSSPLSSQSPPRTLAIYARVLREAWPHRRSVLVLLLLGLLATPLGLLTPLSVTVAVDSVIGGHPPPSWLAALLPDGAAASPQAILTAAVAFGLLTALLTQIQTVAERWLRDRTGQRMVTDFRARLFAHAQRLALTRHDAKGTADALARLDHDADAMQWQVGHVLMPFVCSAAYFAGMLWVMAAINGRLALVALLVAPAFALLTALSHGRLRDRWEAVCEQEVQAKAVWQETLGALRVVRAFGQEAREVGRYRRLAEQATAGLLGAVRAESALGVSVALLLAGGSGAVLWIGVTDVRAGHLTVGELLLALSYLGQLYQPLQNMGHQAAAQQKLLARLARAFALLDELPDPAERPDALAVSRAAGAITFEGVTCSHGTGRPIVGGIDLAIPAGSRVGIVGRSGAGKSTLIGLLTRLCDPDGGRVTLDGHDLRDLKLADLRRQFAIVGQDTVLFSTTVAANIAYGRPEATRDEIVAAAKAAHIHAMVEALPDGYDTAVGERGQRFSGGERQRLALARAFLRDAPILILDEPTSAVDRETERAMMDGIARLMEGRTTFMITHRLETLAGFDLLVEMDAGRIAAVRRPADAATSAEPAKRETVVA